MIRIQEGFWSREVGYPYTQMQVPVIKAIRQTFN